MTRKVLLIFGLLLFEIFCYSLENKLTKDGVTDFFNPLKNWPGENWYYGRSSVLVEDKTDIFHYEHCNIWDEDLSTAWVKGVEGEILYPKGARYPINAADTPKGLPLSMIIYRDKT